MAEPMLPIDKSAPVPPSVARAAAQAEALHKQMYPDSTPAPEPARPAETGGTPETPPEVSPQDDSTPPEVSPQDDKLVEAQAPQPPQPPQQAPQTSRDPYPTKKDDLPADQWKNHYLSMKGRFEQAQTTIGGMQEQMQELGDELVRTQQAMRQHRQAPSAPQTQPPQRLVTDKDIEVFGEDMLDTVRRAAREAVQSDLQLSQDEIRKLNQRLNRQTTQGMAQTLDAKVPNWREINTSPRFKQWCALRDVYSGQVRGDLLNAAIKAADAPRAVAFFNGFLNEEQATGHATEPQEVPETPPRTAAVPLEALSAPGRAKPATGSTSAPVDKPVFTRFQISQFYANVRKGAYTGRDADKARDEAAIFAAQSEGRVRG